MIVCFKWFEWNRNWQFNKCFVPQKRKKISKNDQTKDEVFSFTFSSLIWIWYFFFWMVALKKKRTRKQNIWLKYVKSGIRIWISDICVIYQSVSSKCLWYRFQKNVVNVEKFLLFSCDLKIELKKTFLLCVPKISIFN